MRRALSMALAAGLVVPAAPIAHAADRVVPVIDGFGPYKLGMSLEQAKAADKAAKAGPCGEFAEGRQRLVVNAEVFQEPAVLYAVLDKAGARVERVLAKLDPQLTRRRAYRCVRLSEKVFALLVVVYGSRYKQSYDQNRRPLPAVAWDGEESGRLIFEAKCRTRDEGNPLISVVERYPDGVKPPPVAAAPKSPAVTEKKDGGPAVPVAEDLPPPPKSAPIGPVEETALGAPDISGAAGPGDRMTVLARELAHAKGKAEAADTSQAVLPPPPVTTTISEPVSEGNAAAVASEPSVDAGGSTLSGLDVAPPAIDALGDGNTIAIGEPTEPAAPATPASTTSAVPDASATPVVDPGPVTVARNPDATAAAPQVTSQVTGKVTPPPVATTQADTSVGQGERRPALSDVPAPEAPAEAAVSAPAVGVPSNPAPAIQAPAVEAPVVQAPVAPARTASAPAAPSQTAAPQQLNKTPYRIAALPSQVRDEVRPPDYREAYEPREPTDLEAPEALAMPEEEASFRRMREGEAPEVPSIDAAVRERVAVASAGGENAAPASPAPASPAHASPAPAADTRPTQQVRRTQKARDEVAAAPVAILSAARGTNPAARLPSTSYPPAATPQPAAEGEARAGEPTPDSTDTSDTNVEDTNAGGDTASVAQPFPKGWGNAKSTGFKPVMSGGWRHKAPVPPVRPWRERAAQPSGPASDAG